MPVAKLIKFREGVMRHHSKIRSIKIILFSVLISGTISMPCVLQAQPSPIKKQWVVVIDAGHGGRDPGSIGATKSKEKNVTLDIALKTGKYIKENLKDVKVIYTRDDDTFPGLDERAEVANKNKADIFISIHANAVDDKRPTGTETWVLGQSMDDANLKVAMKENSVITYEENYQAKYEGYDPSSVESFIIFSLMQNTYLKQSTEFASAIQNQFRERVGRKDRGVKQAGFLVLWKTTMPSVLIEVGFITNAEEEKYLLSQEGQEYIASGIYRAFRDYKQTIDSRSGITTIAETKAPETDELPSEPKIAKVSGDSDKSSVKTGANQAITNDKVTEPTLKEVAEDISEIKTETKVAVTKPAGKTVSEAKSQTTLKPPVKVEGKNDIWFMVQIAAVPKNSTQKKDSYKGIDSLTRITDGDRYKFGAGRFRFYEDAIIYRRSISGMYPDAFVIAVRNGSIIPLKDAINEAKITKN